jgi:enoyl-CoA hydratase
MSTKQQYETILFDVKDNIATLTINRPQYLNALSEQVLNEIQKCLGAINTVDSAIKGLILTGEGEKSFIAGADIKAMSTMTNEQAERFCRLGQDTTVLIEHLPIPVVAAVNGFAFGGGSEIAMSADFIYASENALFGLPEVKLGLIPGFGGTQRLARLVGRQAAKEMIFTGRHIKVDEAQSLGLVLQSFASKDELLAAAHKVLQATMTNSSVAISAAKEVINSGVDLTVEQGLAIELKAFDKIFNEKDMTEGVAAFLEKRAPDFSNSTHE